MNVQKLESNLSQLKNSNLFFLFVIKHKQTIYSFQRLVKAFYSVENHLKHTQLTNKILLGFSNKQSIEITKQLIVLVCQQVNQPKQFSTFSETPKSKTISCFDKTTGCFSLSFEKHFNLKSKHFSFRFNKKWITQINYPDPILNTTTTSALHQTLGFGFFKAFDHS